MWQDPPLPPWAYEVRALGLLLVQAQVQAQVLAQALAQVLVLVLEQGPERRLDLLRVLDPPGHRSCMPVTKYTQSMHRATIKNERRTSTGRQDPRLTGGVPYISANFLNNSFSLPRYVCMMWRTCHRTGIHTRA